ncbi:DNA repair protein RecO [Anoxybacillus rupiensis]|uniref:DNA repair protein RecO n=1 Tax=Anoxybacteroides rupiense TaxID=311460 RepID=A0ABD5ISN1_9BACL|nr:MULTISPECIES: DNA repair protein RecO [Anoxybacillus]MBB3906896.1 DNA repair protein RecO (recombination protein O) [Anoxybacillus rupiensis]MBS2769995.1 DNA repair protein RecO [Anoxybacillus rupiensis]MDE8562633.1 DNA repair protein RecO [Anoxybacillus rupiensis]MED5050878.1 DNA repair protein RecO [Anoxybacillus rupiensis]OQM44908.1 DNA repair protein RecO [Anoxybacillus sp. UARK-01]
MFEKCEAIVLRTIDYGETHKIVTLLTREWGKVAVMARGAKKPNSRLSSVTHLFTYGHYLIQKSRGVGSLHQGEIIDALRGIREDIFATAYASYVVELTDKIMEERRPNPYLFELLLQTLKYMNDGLDLEILTYIYEMKMLRVIGLPPSLDGCAVCGRSEGRFSFSIKEGGFLCDQCEEKDPYRFSLSSAAVRLLRLFYHLDLSRLGKISVKKETKNELHHVISAYYDEYSGLSLKTKRFLEQIEQLKSRLQ